MSSVKSHESMSKINTPCGRKTEFFFEKFFIHASHIMDLHLLVLYVNIPNLVYKSLDIGTPYFSTITNFVIEMTSGHVVTLPLGQVVTLLQRSR